MSSVYRKHGRVARFEDGRVVVVSEAGEAVEDGAAFRAAPLNATSEAGAVDEDLVLRTASQVASLAGAGTRVERLIVSHGRARHSCGDRHWEEESRRVHVSFVRGALRVPIDRGDFELDEIAAIVRALESAGSERDAPSRLRLAPNVTAALLPALIGIDPPNVRLIQTAGAYDAYGNRVDDVALNAPPWPNWYRPSYRVRPVRAPFDIRIESDVEQIDEELPEAIAILAPVESLVLRVLVRDGTAVYPATVRVARIDAVGTELNWYPYAAGTFGCKVVL